MAYQGHLPDGSSVQKHSAGSSYPFIVFGQETERGLRFGVMGPAPAASKSRDGTVNIVNPVASCEQACAMADRLAAAYHRIRAARPVAKVYVAATDSTVEVDLNTPAHRAAFAPGGWGVV